MAKELNNLEKALSAIAKGTKAAKDTAAEAKKLAESPTVTAELDDKGKLKLNGTVTEITVIQPSEIAKSVGKALGNSDTPSKLLEEQIKFESAQEQAALKIAVERGKFYVEDALPDKIREKVWSRYYESTKPEILAEAKSVALQIVQAIQAWYDKLPKPAYITSRGGFFPVTKNKGYRPEFYGADGRSIKRNSQFPMTFVVNGQQPCLSFHGGAYNIYDFPSVTWGVIEAGQDVMHICDGADYVTVLHGGYMVTVPYMRFGYVSGQADPGKRLFPHIDGWTKENPHLGTGLGDKGTSEGGFNTTTLAHDISHYMNNACDVSGVKQPEGFNRDTIRQFWIDGSIKRYWGVGGYFNKDGNSEFPQEDGTVSDKWGTWHGGQRGSRGYGIRVFGTRGVRIRDFRVAGFTGGGIALGLLGTPSGDPVGSGDVKKAYSNGMVAVDTKITGGHVTHCYTSGFEFIRVQGVELSGIYQPDSVIGHPDAHLEHTRGWIMSIPSLDPGYQQCTSRYLPMDNLNIHDNVFGLGMRKVIDIHTGNNIRISNNKGSAKFYAASIVIEERFSSPEGDGKTADDYSFYYEDSNIEISRNTFKSGCFGLHMINGGLGVKSRLDAKRWFLRAHQVLDKNVIYAPRGIVYNYGHNHFVITNNLVVFALPFEEFYGMQAVTSFVVENGGSGYTTPPKVVLSGGGEGAFGAEGEAKIEGGKIKEIVVRRSGSRYTTPPTVTLEGGGGSGAVVKATVNNFTSGIQIGAESRYGTVLATLVSGNYVENSPEGNFMRQFLIGNMSASSFVNNFSDVTPYGSVGNVGEPFVSKRIKCRDGLQSGGFYQTGNLETCHVAGNYEYHQIKKSKTPWLGIHRDYKESNYRINELLKRLKTVEDELAKIKTEKPAASETAASPAPANQGEATAATQPATPASPAPAEERPAATTAPAAAETSYKFTFADVEATAVAVSAIGQESVKMKSVINSNRLVEPDGWDGAFKEDAGRKVMVTSSSAGKGTRFIETEGLSSDGSRDTAIIIPFKHLEGGSGNAGAYALSVINGSAVQNIGLISTIEESGGFTLRNSAGVTINGKAIVPTEAYQLDKWYVAVITLKGVAFDRIRVGTNHHGNTARNMVVGAGVEFVQNDLSKVAEKASALMTEYGIQA